MPCCPVNREYSWKKTQVEKKKKEKKGRNATKKIGMPLINLDLLQLVQLHMIWKWVQPFHWKQSPKPLLGSGKTLKTEIFRLLFSSKNGGVGSKKCSDCTRYGMSTSCSVTYFPKVGARFSLKVATGAFFGGKNL